MTIYVDPLTLHGWSPPVQILCAKAGPVCRCGSYRYRTRPEPAPARPHLVRTRCEECGETDLLDPTDPEADLAEIGGRPVTVEQPALF